MEVRLSLDFNIKNDLSSSKITGECTYVSNFYDNSNQPMNVLMLLRALLLTSLNKQVADMMLNKDGEIIDSIKELQRVLSSYLLSLNYSPLTVKVVNIQRFNEDYLGGDENTENYSVSYVLTFKISTSVGVASQEEGYIREYELLNHGSCTFYSDDNSDGCHNILLKERISLSGYKFSRDIKLNLTEVKFFTNDSHQGAFNMYLVENNILSELTEVCVEDLEDDSVKVSW